MFTVAFMGWKGLDNGALLAKAAEQRFDAMVTMDTGVRHQQSPPDLPIAILVLRAPSNALEVLRHLVPALLRALESLTPKTLVVIEG